MNVSMSPSPKTVLLRDRGLDSRSQGSADGAGTCEQVLLLDHVKDECGRALDRFGSASTHSRQGPQPQLNTGPPPLHAGLVGAQSGPWSAGGALGTMNVGFVCVGSCGGGSMSGCG